MDPNIDKLLSSLDDLSRRMDGYEEEEQQHEQARRDRHRRRRRRDEYDDYDDDDRYISARRHDSADRVYLSRSSADYLVGEVERLRRMIPKQETDADYRDMLAAQARADTAYQAHGKAAPRPLQGEGPLTYRRRLVSGLAQYSPRWNGVPLYDLRNDALAIVESDVYNDAVAYLKDPRNTKSGTLREHTSNMRGGHQMTEFYGSPMAWMSDFAGKRCAVTSIRTPGSRNWNEGTGVSLPGNR